MARPQLTMDLGELVHEPEELYAFTDVAMIACGAHAGNTQTIETAVQRARSYGCELGAHPGFADPEHFGRVEQSLSAQELYELCRAQSIRLKTVTDLAGVHVRWLKFHGALYHQVHRDRSAAQSALAGVLSVFSQVNVRVVGMRLDSALAEATGQKGHDFVLEAFADRATLPDGTLVPRSSPGAVLLGTERISHRVRELLASPHVPALLCLHGDHPEALSNAECVRGLLDSSSRGPGA